MKEPKNLREALDAITYASDDGSEYEHNDGCEGEAECAACWVLTIRKTLADHPVLSGEELRVASEKVDQWVREDNQTAPVASRERVAEALMGHQLEWVEGAKTFDCTCNEDGSLDWLGTITEATQHQVDAMLAAGVFRDEATVKAEALREAAAAHLQLAADARTNNGQAEHEDIADWLDDRATAIDPTRTEGAHP